MSKTIVLVACVSKKYPTMKPAQDLYISDWFSKASAFAKTHGDSWFILSARYGLLHPKALIEPYNETLNTMPVSKRRTWAGKVLADLKTVIPAGDKVIILAGMKYREFIEQPIKDMGYEVCVPMEGLKIGEQLRWLNIQNGN